MKVLIFFCALFVAFTAAQIFDQLPGASDEEKIALIRAAVAQVRWYAAGQACFTEHFPTPGDAGTIEHWAAWICSYLGGPATTNGNCTYFEQFGDNDTIVTDPAGLLTALSIKHQSLGISTEASELFTQLLAKALVTTGATSLVDDDVIEALSNATDIIVTDVGGNCRAPDVSITWSNPGTHNNNVVLNGLVTWTWGDDLVHSIAVDTGESAVLVGFGSGDLTLSRTTACSTSSPSFPDGGTPCNLGGGNVFAYSHIFAANDTIGYHCDVHFSTLTGNLIVGNGGSGGTNTNTNTNPPDVDNFDDGGDGGDGSACSLKSWLAL